MSTNGDDPNKRARKGRKKKTAMKRDSSSEDEEEDEESDAAPGGGAVAARARAPALAKQEQTGQEESENDDDDEEQDDTGVGSSYQYRDRSREAAPPPPLNAHKTEEDAADAGNDELPHSTQSFPVKLHRILSNTEYQEIVCWLPHGRAWRILQLKAFEDRVLPLYFRHGRHASFARTCLRHVYISPRQQALRP
jgi:cobalamin biosynthesis protein CobT